MASKVTDIQRPSDVPEKIGKYVIINKIGKGSTGTVYLSHDPYYRRDVAIKVYNLEEDTDAERAKVSRKMFFNEAHMVGMLQHPNIMPIYDAGEEDGSYYVVTEHIQGARTLAAYCRPDNLLRVDDVVEIIYKCAKALHYAHGRGVIHRDIKPSNVMLTIDNDVRIIDFGIAIVSDSDVSRIEGIAGSPSYMSPEQVQSEDLTPRSDLYSLGAVMYELLTGFRPFRADNLSKLLHQIVYATPPPIHTYRDDLPEELEHVVMTTMQKDPGKRLRDRQRDGRGTDARLQGPAPEIRLARQPGTLRPVAHPDVSSTSFRTQRSGKCCARPTGTSTRMAKTSSVKARSMIVSTSSSRARSQSRRTAMPSVRLQAATASAKRVTCAAQTPGVRSRRTARLRFSASARR